MSESRDFTGTISKNQDKDGPGGKPSWPDYKGKALIDGREYWLSAWVKEGREGGKFLSLAFKPKDAAPAAPRPPAPAKQSNGVPFDDGIPF